MNFSICLDQTTTPNFNVTNLSTTGFSIYSNLDLNSPLVQNIPYTSLFESPLGNCPFNLTNIPEGTDYLIVVDQCNTSINVSSIFSPENINAGSITINCCYAIINLNPTPLSICDECNLSFDTFSTSTVGRIIAGTLSSTCGAITDYTIGWYRNGSTTPTFISGIGTTLSWNYPHPMVGNTSPMVLDGSWIGIIHDIIINGITYSSVAGVLGGNPLPFTSCFDTMVVAPFSCANGQSPPPYSHQISFTAQGNNATPPPISATYALSSSTNYFAYQFKGFEIPDILSIKFISGNPNGTNDPSLYSQPIWLDYSNIGSNNWNFGNGYAPGYTNISTLNEILNNDYPKVTYTNPTRRVLTLTNLSRSLNDKLEITVSPSTTNPNTSWALKMQCLDTFGCDDCLEPFSKIKLKKLSVNYNCCGFINPSAAQTSSLCTSSRDKWTYGYGWSTVVYKSSTNWSGENGISINSTSITTTYQQSLTNHSINCTPSTPNSTIKTHKSTRVFNGQLQGVVSMSFNNVTDYNFYKNKLISYAPTQLSLSSTITNPNDVDSSVTSYYSYYNLYLPIDTIACGDGFIYRNFQFHKSAYPLIEYVDNPTPGNDYTITIPQPIISNGIPFSNCNNIYPIIENHTTQYNDQAISPSYFIDVTNTFGSKLLEPIFYRYYTNYTNPAWNYTAGINLSSTRNLSYYSMYTLPFLSSSAGWTNLPFLGGTPCPDWNISSSMPLTQDGHSYGNGYAYWGYESYPLIIFSGSNLNPPYSNIQIYALVTSSNGNWQGNYAPQTLIYEYSGSTPYVYSSSYFHNGTLDLQINYDPNWPC
jgi:hypothetical protein